MPNASQIKEHMEVKGSDGKHVGTVLGIERGRLKLASAAWSMTSTLQWSTLSKMMRSACGTLPSRRYGLGIEPLISAHQR